MFSVFLTVITLQESHILHSTHTCIHYSVNELGLGRFSVLKPAASDVLFSESLDQLWCLMVCLIYPHGQPANCGISDLMLRYFLTRLYELSISECVGFSLETQLNQLLGRNP